MDELRTWPVFREFLRRPTQTGRMLRCFCQHVVHDDLSGKPPQAVSQERPLHRREELV